MAGADDGLSVLPCDELVSCPSQLSLSQLFWATGRRSRIAHPGIHTETLEWLVFACNFNYMYIRSAGRTWVIKRPPPEIVVRSDFTADMWQIHGVANPEDIIQNHKKDFPTYRCNPIQIRLLGDGRRQGTPSHTIQMA